MVAAVASLLLSILNFYLSRKQAENDARRDYQYEARKRLYHEYEPLRFQLLESSENALRHIKDIAAKAHAGDLGPNGWPASRRHYYLKESIYRLLLPCAVYKLMTKRITLVDLQLDPLIHAQYILAKAVCLSYTHDFALADISKLPYTPYVADWREKREENPKQYRRQGFPIGRLDNALDALIESRGDDSYNIASFGRFEEKFDSVEDSDVRSGLGIVRDMFFEFHPDTRPILWRILTVQSLLYDCVLEISDEEHPSGEQVFRTLTALADGERKRPDEKAYKEDIDPDSMRRGLPVAVHMYLDSHVRPLLRRLQPKGTERVYLRGVKHYDRHR